MDTHKRAVLWVAVSSERQTKDDKISLAYQEEVARAWCARNGYDVLEVLRVEGHSRSDPNLIRLLELYKKKGVLAYERLQALWATKGFDVLVAYSSDRLGRSGTLIHWVIETTFYEGMQICLTEGGGLMDASNYRMQTLLGTAQATMPMDAFRDKTKQTKAMQAARGFSTGRWPLSHRPIRDPASGDAIGVELNQEALPLLTTLAEQLIARKSWRDIAVDLYKAHGHLATTENGRLFNPQTVRRLILNSWIFGHVAQYHGKPGKAYVGFGRWLFDEDEAPSSGVEIYRNVVPPVFAGELLEELKAALRQRFEVRGRGSAGRAHRFARLVVCADCGYFMSGGNRKQDRPGLVPYRCTSRWSKSDVSCQNTKTIPLAHLQAFISRQIERYLSLGLETKIPRMNESDPDDALASQVVRLNAQIDRLMIEQSLATEDMQPRYRRMIEDLGLQLASAEQQQRADETRRTLQKHEEAEQAQMRAYFAATPLEVFWTLPDPQINQILLRFFGDRKLSVRDGEVVKLKRRVTRRS